jgi:hypothetical protein
MSAGATVPFNVTVRNNGWNVIPTGAAAANGTRVMVQYAMGTANGVAFLDVDLQPGEAGVFSGEFTAPLQAGTYELAYQLRQGWDDTGDFDNRGNPAWFATVTVQ